MGRSIRGGMFLSSTPRLPLMGLFGFVCVDMDERRLTYFSGRLWRLGRIMIRRWE